MICRFFFSAAVFFAAANPRSISEQRDLHLGVQSERSLKDNRFRKIPPVSSPYWDDKEGAPPQFLPNFNVADLMAFPSCPRFDVVCEDKLHFRTSDGTCNNQFDHLRGSSGSVLNRILHPIYDFGIMRIRGTNGNLLPNPRIISNHMKAMTRRENKTLNNVLWLFFGQFVDHDFVLTPKAREVKEKVNCTACDSWRKDSACAPILVPLEDESLPSLFPNKDRHCLEFVRSSAIPSKYVGLGPALEQINFNTAYLDLSQVYGSDKCMEENIRLHHYGQIIEQRHPLDFRGMPYLKRIDANRDCQSPSGKCPFTGDLRSVENIGLLCIHTIFLREHNRLARKLYRVNSHWSDERIYQEARRINIAQYQKIVYEDFLPLMIGEKQIDAYQLRPAPKNYYLGYNPDVDAQVLTEFATAAFRVGHTMVPNKIQKMDKFYFPQQYVLLKNVFRNITTFYEENLIEDLTRGMIATKVEAVDPVIEDAIRENLFIKKSNPFTAQDLISLNIARGRDHGIPGYTAFREVCGLSPINSWNQMKIFKEDLNILRKVYANVHDVDLFVGGLTEFPEGDGIVGPTFSCIIAQQFRLSRIGDKFWYENSQNHLTLDQLRTIKEASGFNRIIAFNMQEMYLPEDIFMLPDRQKNPLVSTNSIKDLNFGFWKENALRNVTCSITERLFNENRCF